MIKTNGVVIKKKASPFLIILGAILAGYFGYLVNGAWEAGMKFNTFLERFNEICKKPFANYLDKGTMKAVVIALVVYAIAIIMYLTSQRKFMPGKEYGTATFANISQVNKILADKEEGYNRVLSQNIKMSLNTRHTKLNNNVLIIGGSGAGKTFYEVKPNLMQMPHNCSFICTDPKGEILRSCGSMLKNNGYTVKVINLLEMDKSDCYNPFSYIREETDIVKLITNLISNTIGMLYTQIFQELYYQADFNCGGRLPIHVTFMLDEFANVALPDDYCSLLSTMRSREISSVIIIQNLAQIKALFKDTWETIPGNCDTMVYLGGNEQSTHKYVSELLGKGTIDKKSSGETKGRNGSSSRNFDVLGRELLTPDEARKLDNKKCLIFIRGFDPIIDNKFIPFAHPAFNQTADGKGEAYVYSTNKSENVIGPSYEILSKEALRHYEKCRDNGENVYIDKLTYDEFQMLGEQDLAERFMSMEEKEQKEMLVKELNVEIEYPQAAVTIQPKDRKLSKTEIPRGEDSITRRMILWVYSKEQKEELKNLLNAGMPAEEIMEFYYPETSVDQMKEIRLTFEEVNARK